MRAAVGVAVALARLSVGPGTADTSPATVESAVIPSYSLAVGEVDGDGKLDLVRTSAYDSTVSVLRGNGDGTFLPPTAYATGGYPSSVAIGDLDGDGKPDLAVANLRANTVSVLPGNGDGTFRAKSDFAAGYGPRSVAIADLNGDGRPDLAVANAHSKAVSVLWGAGDGTFGERSEFAAGNDPSSVVVADFDGDAHPDLAVVNWDGQGYRWSTEDRDYISSVSILRGGGDGTFGPKSDVTTGGFPLFVGTGDLNRDGTADLMTAGQSARSLSVLLGRGDGTFRARSVVRTCGYGGASAAIADLNADGLPDVAITDFRSRSVSILLGYGDGGFAPGLCFPTVGWPVALVIGDFGADGKPDVVVAEIDPDTFSVLRNEDLDLPPAPLPRSSYSLGLWPNPTRGPTDLYWVVPRWEYPVEISLFDLAGRRVRELLSDPRVAPGVHSVHWDGLDDRGRSVRAGVYLVRLRVGFDVRVARLVVVP